MIKLGETRRMSRASLALLAALALGSSSAPALARSSTNQDVDPHQFRADLSVPYRHYVPVNGAQIMGGFGVPGDLIDNDTGQILHR